MALSTEEKRIDVGIDLDWLTRKIEYRNFQECIHCGLCTASCPTYVETGDENDNPRGRIYLMRAVIDGRLAMGPDVRRHLELCLNCRACESACPSGVRYGTLIEPFKIALQKDAAGRCESQPAPADDPAPPVPLRGPGQGRAGPGAAVPEARPARLGREIRNDESSFRRPCGE